MKKIIDINGYIDYSFSYNYNNDSMLDGKIIYNEDGWFEGIVSDKYSSDDSDKFVFGIFNPDSSLELIKISTNSLPIVYHGIKDGDEYKGIYEIVGLYGTMPCGISHISTKCLRKTSNEEICSCEQEVEKLKDNMNEMSSQLYYNYYTIREKLKSSLSYNFEENNKIYLKSISNL